MKLSIDVSKLANSVNINAESPITRDGLGGSSNVGLAQPVSAGLFGGIAIGRGNSYTELLASLADYVGVTHVRWPGGTLAETGVVTSDGVLLHSGKGAFFYDLGYPDLIEPTMVKKGAPTLSEMLEWAQENNTTFQMLIPTIRYVNDEKKCRQDVARFLEDLFTHKKYGDIPSTGIILDLGNEGLAWKDPKTYATVTMWMLEEVHSFRSKNPNVADDFKVSIQSGWSRDITEDIVSSYQQGLSSAASSITKKALLEIDIVRFHILDKSLLDADLAEHDSRGGGDAAPLLSLLEALNRAAGTEKHIDRNVSAWSVNGGLVDSQSNDIPKIMAATSTVSMIASLVQMDIGLASAWGFQNVSATSTSLSYEDRAGALRFTFAGHAFKLMAESIVGSRLVETPELNRATIHRATHYVKAFTDETKSTIFLTAGTAREGSKVSIGLENFGKIGYAFAVALDQDKTRLDDGSYFMGPIVKDHKVSFHGSVVETNFLSKGSLIRIISYGEDNFRDGKIFGSSKSDTLLCGNDPVPIYGLRGNDRIFGAEGSDSLFGGSGKDVISGGGGDDRVHSGFGNDTVFGSAGSDSILGQLGNDKILGGADDDFILAGVGRDTCNGQSGDDFIGGGGGADLLLGGIGNDEIEAGQGKDSIYGGAGSDSLFGGAGDDIVLGDVGRDVLNGDIGNDLLCGGLDTDNIFGGAGRDTIVGGEGRDFLSGGGGADVFVFSSIAESGESQNDRDTIIDFKAKVDKIDLSNWMDVDFDFSRGVQFSGHAEEILLQVYDTGTMIWFDLDGDRVADASIKVLGAELTSHDFIL